MILKRKIIWGNNSQLCQQHKVYRCTWNIDIRFIYSNEGGNLNFLCFVCHVEGSQNQNTSCWAMGTIGKSLTNRGALIWFPNVLTYGEKVIEHQITFFIKNSFKIKI